ncbi:hypothetical protein IFM89_025751 [Coptis chinensis]|uniref:SBP-type domain-containing protein n=1 Tax=Coptis chinensis TaxID=261450 RepID=A0A835H0Z9_9MAGN|nr:hypothetical protein IFM89_025751 [Coptis chinensis]
MDTNLRIGEVKNSLKRKQKAEEDNFSCDKKKAMVKFSGPPIEKVPYAERAERLCQAENCIFDLKDAKVYYRKHRVCQHHFKAPVVKVSGLLQRFHELPEFDEAKRSCRTRLAGHNERRRKSCTESHGDSSSCINMRPMLDIKKGAGRAVLNLMEISQAVKMETKLRTGQLKNSFKIKQEKELVWSEEENISYDEKEKSNEKKKAIIKGRKFVNITLKLQLLRFVDFSKGSANGAPAIGGVSVLSTTSKSTSIVTGTEGIGDGSIPDKSESMASGEIGEAEDVGQSSEEGWRPGYRRV